MWDRTRLSIKFSLCSGQTFENQINQKIMRTVSIPERFMVFILHATQLFFLSVSMDSSLFWARIAHKWWPNRALHSMANCRFLLVTHYTLSEVLTLQFFTPMLYCYPCITSTFIFQKFLNFSSFCSPFF